MKEERPKWFGHELINDEECVERKVLEIELPDGKKRGRPMLIGYIFK